MRRLDLISFATSLAFVLVPAAGHAASADGVWMRMDGMARVQFAPCGSNTCGTVVWLKHPDGPGRVGERVFFGMTQTASNSWTGTAHNPEDGNDYDGSLTVSGNRMTTKGCALGGAICKSQTWSRVR